MASLSPFIFPQWLDNNGDPLSLGTITFYRYNTLTLADTYEDADGDSANANPVQLDSSGRPPVDIFLQSIPYDIVLMDSLGNTVRTATNIQGGFSGSGLVANVASVAALRALAYGVINYVLMGDVTAGALFYYWDESSSAADNGTTIIKPDDNPGFGRWLALSFSGAPSSGSFTITATGLTATVTGTAYYYASPGIVTLTIPFLQGTSNATSFTLTGLPAAIRPGASLPIQVCPITTVTDSGTVYPGAVYVSPSTGTLLIAKKLSFNGDYTTVWTGSGSKQFGDGVDFTKAFNITYRI